MVGILAMPATVHWKSRYDVEMDSKKLRKPVCYPKQIEFLRVNNTRRLRLTFSGFLLYWRKQGNKETV